MKDTLIRFGLPLLLVVFAAAACPAGERVVERQRQVSRQHSGGFFSNLRAQFRGNQRQRQSQRHNQQNFRLEINNGHHHGQNLRLENNHRNRGELVLRVEADHHGHAGEVQRFFLRSDGHGRTVERQVVRTYVERQELDACDDKQSFRLDLNDGECRAFFKSH